jgi:hypothetical protein
MSNTCTIRYVTQDEETSLQKLNLADCKLKTDLNNVINALGSNQCLQVSHFLKVVFRESCTKKFKETK